MFSRRTLVALGVGAVSMSFAPMAHAGNVSVDAAGVLHYDATSGQDNIVLVHQSSAQTMAVQESAPSTPTPGPGCVHTTDDQVVFCTASSFTKVFMAGGDQSDQLFADNVAVPVEMQGGSGNDKLEGGTVGDTLEGGAGSDNMIGGPGDDTIVTSDCSDLVNGGDGNDHVLVGGGNALISGGPGNDRFEPRPTNCALGNVIFGGEGFDTFDLTGPTGWRSDIPAVVNLNDLTDDGPVSDETWNVHSDIEAVLGGPEPDFLAAGGGSQILGGGGGDDTIDGGLGADSLTGGDGTDTIDYSRRAGPVRIDLRGAIVGNLETASPSSGNGENGENDSLSGFENAVGGSGADTIIGNSANNKLNGGLGPDTMTGGPGLDTIDYSSRNSSVVADLDGQPGDDGQVGEGDTIGADVEGLIGGIANDTLTGNNSDGVIIGGPGADRIADPGGRDQIEGDAGEDVIFVHDNAVDTVTCGPDADFVDADTSDQVAGDCETVQRPAAPTSPPNTLLGPHPARFFRTSTPTFTFSSDIPGSTFKCRLDGDADGPCASPFTTRSLADGLHKITITAVSPAGVPDPRPYEFLFRVDTAKPTVRTRLGAARCVGHVTPVRVTVSARDANRLSRLEIKLGSHRLSRGTKSPKRVTVTNSLVRRFGRTLRVRATDKAGNTTSRSLRVARCL